MKTVADLRARLQELHQRTSETPLFNPVFQLGHDVSRALESGAMDLDRVEHLVAHLSCEALQSRARRIHRLLAPVDPADNLQHWRALATHLSHEWFLG